GRRAGVRSADSVLIAALPYRASGITLHPAPSRAARERAAAAEGAVAAGTRPSRRGAPDQAAAQRRSETMSERKIRITAGAVSIDGTLNDSLVADEFWEALPIKGRAQIW